MATITIEIDSKLKRAIARRAKERQVSIDSFITASLETLVKTDQLPVWPYELTPEAERAFLEAEEDFKAGRYTSVEASKAGDYVRSLIAE